MKSRLLHFGIFFALITAEICIGLFADPSGFVRGKVGDILVIPTIYFLIRIFGNPIPRFLPAAVFLIGCIAELIQATNIYSLIGIPKESLIAVIIGTTADISDIFCYLTGTVLIYLYMYRQSCAKIARHTLNKFTDMKGDIKNVRKSK